MSLTWRCIFCGETIVSKCPSSRNTFPSMIEGIIGSVTTFNHVKDMEDNLSELFISFTSGAKDAATAFKQLVELMKDHMDYPSKNVCNHMYVINSFTVTTCTLGHTHPNLNDVDKLLEEHKDSALKPQTIKHMLKEYADVAIIPIEQARKDVNRTKPKFDTIVEQDFSIIKYNIRRDLDRIANGVSVQDPFRVRIHIPYPERDRCIPFREMADAVDFIHGRALRGQASTLETLDETGERYIDVHVQPKYTCVICQHEANPSTDVVAITTEGIAHLTCINKIKNDSKVKRRTSCFNLRGDKTNSLTVRMLKERYEMESLEVYYVEEQGITRVYLCVMCDHTTHASILKDVKQMLI